MTLRPKKGEVRSLETERNRFQKKELVNVQFSSSGTCGCGRKESRSGVIGAITLSMKPAEPASFQPSPSLGSYVPLRPLTCPRHFVDLREESTQLTVPSSEFHPFLSLLNLSSLAAGSCLMRRIDSPSEEKSPC